MFAIVSAIALTKGALAISALSALLFAAPLFLYSIRLYLLGKKEINLFRILQFYFVYFPARAIGTLGGVIKVIKG